MILRIVGAVFALAAVPVGTAMIVRRLRTVVAGDIIDGTIVSTVAARAGGAFVFHLAVETEDPDVGTREVRAYREFEVDTRVRIWVHPSERNALLAEWSHIGYEVMIGVFVLMAGILAAVAALVL